MIRTRIREKKTVLVTQFHDTLLSLKRQEIVVARIPGDQKRTRVSLDCPVPREIGKSWSYIFMRSFSLFVTAFVYFRAIRVNRSSRSRSTTKLIMKSRGENEKCGERIGTIELQMIDPRNRDKRFARFHPGDQRNTVDIIHVH